LTDPKEGIVNSYVYAINKFGIEESNPAEVASFIGPSIHLYFANRHKLSESDQDLAVKYYREYFSIKGLYENKLYAGIEELLESLRTAGTTIYLVTSKPTVYAKEIMRHFNIAFFFESIYGSELSVHNTPKEKLIADCLAEENLSPENCIMVGDRMHDVVGARTNGVKSCAVTYGYGSRKELEEAKPDYVVDTVESLRELLTESL
jgi:phosphoglycolate phosphatase